MKLHPSQLDEASLLRLGREAVSLLEKRDFQSLASRFGYALAFGRNPAAAIEEDLQRSVAAFLDAPEQPAPPLPSIVAKYFPPNNTNLFAVIECVFISQEGCPVLAELIVTASGGDKYISLEDVCLATG